jgi:hypothetical protein
MVHNCSVCFIEFPEGTSQYLKIHEECMKCIYCGNAVGEDIIEKLIKDQGASSRGGSLSPSDEPLTNESSKILVYHPYCHTQKLEADFKNKPVIITQGHLDMLNAANLLFKPNLELSVQTNQKQAEYQSHKFIHEMTLEEKFIALKRLEAVAAMWSIALSKDKHRIQIQLDEKERIKHKELQQEGDKLEYEKKRQRKNVTAALAGNLTPEEKQFEKAVAAFMRLGMSRDTAIIQLEAMKPKVQ